MAGLATSGSNPDVSLLYDINHLARATPGWLDRAVALLADYGLPLGLLVLVVLCWWTERRRAGSTDAAVVSAAAVVWAPLAAAVAVLVNMPIRDFVRRPRPAVDHEGVEELVPGHGFSFVSDHATLAMAVAAGLFVASRRFGLTGLGIAVAEGFCRVFLGVQYPTDVVGGFALGTAVALLLSPLATVALTPLVRAVARTGRAGWLVVPPHLRGGRDGRSLRLQSTPERPDRLARDSAAGTHGQPEPGGRTDSEDPREPDLAA